VLKPLEDCQIKEEINDYVQHRTPPASFLQAVLENDLMNAVGRADDENLKRLPSIVHYIYWNVVPISCYGSKEAVATWLEGSEI